MASNTLIFTVGILPQIKKLKMLEITLLNLGLGEYPSSLL